MGMWREELSGHLSQDGFMEKFLEIASKASYDWILEAPGDDGLQPVGLILARRVVTGESLDQEIIEPFVEWFPWATNRNRLEATAVFLREIPKQFKVFVFAAEGAVSFWGRFVRYGMVRRGCKVVDYFSRGEHAMLFYTVNQ